MNNRQIGNETKWAGRQPSLIAHLLWETRFDPGIPPSIPLICAFARGLVISIVVGCCLLVPSKSAAFDFGKALKDATQSIEDKITGKTNEKVDEGEKETEIAPTVKSSEQERQTVMEVQQRLNALGYNAGSADGMLGAKSVTAIKAFQRDHGLAATGQVSPELLIALQKAGGSDPAVGAQGPATTASSQLPATPSVTPTSQSTKICSGNHDTPSHPAIPWEEEREQVQHYCATNTTLSLYNTDCCVEKFRRARLQAGQCADFYNVLAAMQYSECGYKNQAAAAKMQLDGLVNQYVQWVAIAAAQSVCGTNENKARQIRTNFSGFLSVYAPSQVSLAQALYDEQYQQKLGFSGGKGKCKDPQIHASEVGRWEKMIVQGSGKPPGLAPGAIP